MEKQRHHAGTELLVLQLVAEGDTDRQIAARLGLAEGSVHIYCRRLCQKTGCTNRVQLARYAVARGLVPVAWTPPDDQAIPAFATKI